MKEKRQIVENPVIAGRVWTTVAWYPRVQFFGKVQVVAYNACPIAAARVRAQEDGTNCVVRLVVVFTEGSFTLERAAALCTEKASMCFVKVVGHVRVCFKADCHVIGATAETPWCGFVVEVEVKIVAITFTFMSGEVCRSQGAAKAYKFVIFGEPALPQCVERRSQLVVRRGVFAAVLVNQENR